MKELGQAMMGIGAGATVVMCICLMIAFNPILLVFVVPPIASLIGCALYFLS